MDKKCNNLHEYIGILSDRFRKIQEKYKIAKLELEFEDAKYKEDENNIFGDISFKKLSKYIETEAQLYRVNNLHYKEIKDIIDKLIFDISDWIKNLQYRKIQGISEAKRIYDGEKYYLKDLTIRLDYNSSILECLIDVEEIEKKMLDQGIDISANYEYEIFMLNKCILLNQVSYCRKECIITILELNDRVNNSSRFSSEFLYKLGELNFELQNYNEAQLFLRRAIEKLEVECNDDMVIGEEKETANDMLFSAYQLQILGYEFCGEYDKAIYLLTENDNSFSEWDDKKDVGLKCAERVVAIFESKLKEEGGIETLIYSNDNTDKANKKRKCIIILLDNIFKEQLFNSPIFCYAHKPSNQKIFERLVKMENDKLQKRISEGGKKNDKKEKIIFNTNKLLKENNNIIYEYIHILAHCLNEYGVTCFRNANKIFNNEIDCPDETFIRKLITIGRALMLYVSDKVSIYKTCYATTYAEAGDFVIANNELKRVINNEEYKAADVTTKAEIAFFTYLINSFYKIEKGVLNQFNEKDELYNRYLNYCYRSFDYDAIAHMKVYAFRHNMAYIMQHSNLKEMADNFFSFIENKDSVGRTPFEKFIHEVYFQSTNRRLKCEYEKVKYMYFFLEGVFRRFKNSEENIKSENMVNGTILDYALKYMHFHNMLLNDSDNDRVHYAISSDIDTIKGVFPDAEVKKTGIKSAYCEIMFLETESQKAEFIQTLRGVPKYRSNKIFFVICKDSDLFKQKIRNEKDIKARNIKNIRFLESQEKGIYEFIIINTFLCIKNDFSNPKNIFVLTPINTAKSCKYRVSNDVELITNGFSKKDTVFLDEPQNMSAQYTAVAERFSDEEPWDKELNSSKLSNDILLIISLMYDKENDNNFTKYKYKYDVSEEWKSAVLFLPKSFFHLIDNLYEEDNVYDRTKMHKGCHNPSNSCSVLKIDNVCNWRIGDESFDEIIKSFPEVDFSNLDVLLLWCGENGSFASWRMVFIKNNCKINKVDRIKQIMCSSGRGLQFSAKNDAFVFDWPEPFDFINNKNEFLFICHAGDDDEIIKKELNEFFKLHSIPVWYDKNRFIADEGWKKKIKEVIQNKQCVGCIVMVTNKDFFKSKAIQYELITAGEEHEQCVEGRRVDKKRFIIMPIVYGLDEKMSEKNKMDELKRLIRNPDFDRDCMNNIEKCIIPGDDKVITFINKNQSLEVYSQLEKKEGRNSSVLYACAELGIDIKQ